MSKRRKTLKESEIVKASILLGINEEDLMLALDMLDSLKQKLEDYEKENNKKNK